MSDRELSFSRVVDATRERLYAGWTDPALLPQWFAPRPLTTTVEKMDVRPGGAFRATMRTPGGQEFPQSGVFLELVPNERIVFTDAFTEGWDPRPEHFFVGIVTLEDLGDGKTRYTATVRHWTAEAREQHEKMGFEAGWDQCLDQLVELASR